MTDSEPLLIITTTVETAVQAEQLAASLVQQRLAACVQIDGPITSHYVWQGVPQATQEWRLTIKTVAAAERRLRPLLPTLHPYELPQWVVIAADNVSPQYLAWVRQAVAAAEVVQSTAAFHVYLYGPGRGPLPIGFETLLQRLQAQPRVHAEPDGSFVWKGDAWQIDGMIYDLGETVQYLELKGGCGRAQWQQLMQWLAPPDGQLAADRRAVDRRAAVAGAGVTDGWLVWLIGEQRLQDLQGFERACWPDAL